MQGINGNRWSSPNLGDDHNVLTHILRARGITADKEAAFLKPSLRDELPDPHTLLGMNVAAKRLSDDIAEHRKVGIFTDYDADGATSAGVLGRWLRMSGSDFHRLVVPDRIKHGYGPNADLINTMFDEGCESVYILDSGTAAANVLNSISEERRKRIYVIDHHMPSGVLPDVATVVNPNRIDQEPGLGHLAAVGVTFLLCVAAQRNLIQAGLASKESMNNLVSLMDYVAVGTVCDVVSLTRVNRAFVSAGIRQVSRSEDNPLGALLIACSKKADEPISASDFGFGIGPRINAEGRIGQSDSGARFLLETDPQLIKDGAAKLSLTNSRRQAMEKSTTATAVLDADTRPDALVVVAVAEGHEGVVGISASRLKDRYNAPAIVLTSSEGGNLKGSARSVDGFNIGEAIHHAADAGIIIRGGGHAMAGGLTLPETRLDDFRNFMNEAYKSSPAWGRDNVSFYDLSIPAHQVTVNMRRDPDALEPCGRDNPLPRLVITNAHVDEIFIMSGKHVKAKISSIKTGTKALDAIIWNGVGTPLGDALASFEGRDVSLAGRVEINSYNGKESLQMMVEDVMEGEPPVNDIRITA